MIRPRSIAQPILDVIDSHEIDLLVLGWRGHTAGSERVLGTTLDPLMRRAQTDIAVLKASEPLPGTAGADEPAPKVVCPVTGSKHGQLGMELAEGVAGLLGGRCRYIHFRAPDDSISEGVQNLLDGGVPVQIMKSRHVEEALTRQADRADLLVIGASRESLPKLLMFGSMPETIARETGTPVLLVKKYAGKTRGALRELFRPLEAEEIAAFEQHHDPPTS